jgi:hypothetical protein
MEGKKTGGVKRGEGKGASHGEPAGAVAEDGRGACFRSGPEQLRSTGIELLVF